LDSIRAEVWLQSRGHRARSESASLAKKLGASVYIDNQSAETQPKKKTAENGGARVILATAPSSKAMSETDRRSGAERRAHGDRRIFDPIEVAPVQLINGSRRIQGWAAGTPADSDDTLRFAELTGVRP